MQASMPRARSRGSGALQYHLPQCRILPLAREVRRAIDGKATARKEENCLSDTRSRHPHFKGRLAQDQRCPPRSARAVSQSTAHGRRRRGLASHPPAAGTEQRRNDDTQVISRASLSTGPGQSLSTGSLPQHHGPLALFPCSPWHKYGMGSRAQLHTKALQTLELTAGMAFSTLGSLVLGLVRTGHLTSPSGQQHPAPRERHGPSAAPSLQPAAVAVGLPIPPRSTECRGQSSHVTIMQIHPGTGI